jgi:hypothetical protein
LEGQSMTTSRTIAGLIGPTLVALAAATVLNLGYFPALVEGVSRDPALVLVSGILMFVAGLAIVRIHNRWASGWPVVVTVIGWLALLGGLARMLFPVQLSKVALALAQRTGIVAALAIVLLVVGGFLCFKAYGRE